MKELQRSFNAVNMCRNVTFLTDVEIQQLIELILQVLNAFKIEKQTQLDSINSQKNKVDEEDVELIME